jgi:hypothetical protein
MEIKLELDTDKTARAAVTIAAAYALCRVSKHSESSQLAAANAIALNIIISILYGPPAQPPSKNPLKTTIKFFCDYALRDHPPLQGGT